MIDIIDKDTMEYNVASPTVKGGFDSSLHFKWDNMSPREMSSRTSPVQPIRTPAIAGGLFAVDRDWFQHIGEYDSQMDIWGAENVGMLGGLILGEGGEGKDWAGEAFDMEGMGVWKSMCGHFDYVCVHVYVAT